MNSATGHPSPTRRLMKLGIAASSSVALLAILGQIFLHSALVRLSSDTQLVNATQRQSVLTQRLSNDALALQAFPDQVMRQQNLDDLRAALALWQGSQEGLQHGDRTLG